MSTLFLYYNNNNKTVILIQCIQRSLQKKIKINNNNNLVYFHITRVIICPLALVQLHQLKTNLFKYSPIAIHSRCSVNFHYHGCKQVGTASCILNLHLEMRRTELRSITFH